MNLKRLLFLKAASGETTPRERTITGNPVSFRTEYDEPMKLIIPFTPVQAGSGTPSPENVRAISGFDGVTVNVSATQTGGTEYNIAFPSTCYGGTLTVNADGTGTLVVDRGFVTLTESSQLSNFSANASLGASARISSVSDAKNDTDRQCLIASSCVCVSYANRGQDTKETARAFTNSYANISVRASINNNASTVEELFSIFEGCQFAYELATPTTTSLSPGQVKSIIGQNYVWTNTNGENTVTYIK